jgi:hypothetical protein
MCAGTIEKGAFNSTKLGGLNWVLLVYWPGEIAEGNGTEQAIIDARATPEQREALRKILHGESTAPGATHFYVYNSTMTTVLETLYEPIELVIDIDARTAHLKIADLVESEGAPIIGRHGGSAVRAGIHLPAGFEYTYAEMGNGNTKARAGIHLDLTDSYGHFCRMDLSQDGVVR